MEYFFSWINWFFSFYSWWYGCEATVTKSVLEDTNVQILGAVVNNVDVTKNIINYIENNFDYHIVVADLIDLKHHHTFKTLEIMSLVHGQLRNHTYNSLDDTIDVHYGIDWPKYLDTRKTLNQLEYLDLNCY